MREQFSKTIFADGTCGLALRTPTDRENEEAGHYLLPDGATMPQKDVTPLLLHMLAEAYYAGYEEAVYQAGLKVQRLMYENSNPCKPAAKISSILDYRGKSGSR